MGPLLNLEDSLMTLMVTGEVVANRVLNKVSVVVTEIIVEVPANNIAIYAGSTVALRRQVEMVTGWNFLWNGIRDRNLMDVQFAGSVLYSGTDIDKKGENDRRTESVVASFSNNDIIVGVGLGATGEFKGAVLPLDSALEQLIQVARESLLLKAA